MKRNDYQYPEASAPPMPSTLPTVIAINTIRAPSYDQTNKPTYKGLLTGNAVKSTFMVQMRHPLSSSIGTDFTIRNFDQFKCQLWDIATHERFQTITESYFRNAHFALSFPTDFDGNRHLTVERLKTQPGWQLFSIAYTPQANGSVQVNFAPLTDTAQSIPSTAFNIHLDTALDIIEASIHHVRTHSVMALRGTTAPAAPTATLMTTTGMLPVAVAVPIVDAVAVPVQPWWQQSNGGDCNKNK